MERIIEGMRYDTATAKLLADDEFSDGTNRLTRGRARALYLTAKGRYFVTTETQWQGERDTVEPFEAEDARREFEAMPNQHQTYFDAGFSCEDA